MGRCNESEGFGSHTASWLSHRRSRGWVVPQANPTSAKSTARYVRGEYAEINVRNWCEEDEEDTTPTAICSTSDQCGGSFVCASKRAPT
jgi:hypothetical protein